MRNDFIIAIYKRMHRTSFSFLYGSIRVYNKCRHINVNNDVYNNRNKFQQKKLLRQNAWFREKIIKKKSG